MQSTPAVHLGIVLRECRIRGYEFDKAWETAMRSLPRGRTPEQRFYLTEWKDALRWAKSNFRQAYEVSHERNGFTRQPDGPQVTSHGARRAGAATAGAAAGALPAGAAA
jgi:hypothetical protein